MPVQSSTQYATQTNLAQLGLIGGVLTSISGTIQDAALVAASAIADSYLQSRYDLPLTNWGQDLVRVVCQIAAYDLLTSKGFNPATGPDENIRQRYLDALAWLQEVSQGKQTPAYVVDSSTGSGSLPPVSPTDGSVALSTGGGLQMQTANVRGWTSRNSTNGGNGFWDGGFNSK